MYLYKLIEYDDRFLGYVPDLNLFQLNISTSINCVTFQVYFLKIINMLRLIAREDKYTHTHKCFPLYSKFLIPEISLKYLNCN